AKDAAERRRRRVLFVAAALVVLTLVGGVIGTTLGMFEAKRQKGVAETEKTRAEQNFATARAMVLELGSQVSQVELQMINPRAADSARRAALDNARKQFDQFRTSKPDDEDILKQAAVLHRYAANVYRLLSDYAGAEAAYTSAIQISEDLATRFPDKPE